MIDIRALLNVPCVEAELGFDLSPDGRMVAFAWNPGGTWEIFQKRLHGDKKPEQISQGPGSKFNPRYSPDGQKLAFAVDCTGSENFHIILHDLQTGVETDLTPNVRCSLQANFAWSPDGHQIALISDHTGQFNVYILDIDKPKVSIAGTQLLLDAGFPAWKVSWSPDGRWLAVVVEARGIDFGTFIVPANGRKVIQISEHGKPIDAGQACWSPDSQFLAFSSDSDGYNNIGIYAMATHQIEWLTSGEGEKQYPCWSPDGKYLTYVYNRGTVSWLVLHGINKPPAKFQLEPGVHYLPTFTRNGNSIVFGFDNPRHPTDLWMLSLNGGSFAQLTHSMPEDLQEADLVMPEEITYPGMDGTPVPALLFKPKIGNTDTAVLVVHGGPDWFFEMTWYPIMTTLASRGWIVLVPNYRGSTGYGRDWQEASRFDFGGVDTDDVAAGALFLINQGLAHPRKIGITGRSHGGFLTASCMTRYPDLWAVGSAIVPFLNWFTNHKEIRPDLQQWDFENFGDPIKDYDLWKERSPSFFMDCIKAPLQLICGRNDVRCPISDSIQAYNDLKNMKKTVELVIYEDEGHSFLKKENVLDSEIRRVDFLVRYMENRKD
jgi:dipeptidyl aminopeptidase/acylaminoacyl peptidase